jgi:predicted  nucleic acid-binding Zn-ribbon protein
LNKHLEQLVKLSKFDQQIVSFDPKIENEQEKLKAFTKVVDEIKANVDKLYLVIDETKNKRIKNDIHLKELSTKLDEIEQKYKKAKNEKEIKALQLEEEIAKDQIAFANEEIVRLDNLIATKSKELEELNKELKTEEDSVKELKDVIDANITKLEEEKAKLYEEKSNLISTVDTKILTFYEKIKRWAKETTVVPVKKQACYGCYMKLNDRFYSEFLTTDEIMTCPHCGRIIYKEDKQETTQE